MCKLWALQGFLSTRVLTLNMLLIRLGKLQWKRYWKILAFAKLKQRFNLKNTSEKERHIRATPAFQVQNARHALVTPRQGPSRSHWSAALQELATRYRDLAHWQYLAGTRDASVKLASLNSSHTSPLQHRLARAEAHFPLIWDFCCRGAH